MSMKQGCQNWCTTRKTIFNLLKNRMIFSETPEDYQPPFFDSKDYMSTLKSKLEMEDCPYESTALARINTGFHYFTFVFKKKSVCLLFSTITCPNHFLYNCCFLKKFLMSDIRKQVKR